MKILIVEDEALIASRIERLIHEILGEELHQVSLKTTLESAQAHIAEHPIDLLLLDLNLNGKDGFQVLQTILSQSFQTVVISANTDRAIEAFAYGVLDFIPKPFNKKRIAAALQKLHAPSNRPTHPLKYLSVRQKQGLALIDIDNISFLKGAGNYSEIHQINGQKDLHDKSLQTIALLLPPHFERLHKSYIVNIKTIKNISANFKIHLVNDSVIPISRTEYRRFKDQ